MWHGLGRRRAALIVVAVVGAAIARLVAGGGSAGLQEPGLVTAHPTGDAFADQSGIVTTGPVGPGSFVTFGSTLLRNTSGGPVTLLRAEPVWVEHVEVANLGVSPYGPTVPISELDVHAADAVPIRGFVVPPSAGENDELYGITLELRLDPRSVAGIVVGLDLQYRSNGKVHVQRFPIANMVCRAEGTPCGPDFGIDVLRSDPARLLEDAAEDGTLSTVVPPPD